MDRVDTAQLAHTTPLRVSPMAHAPAGEVALQRSAAARAAGAAGAADTIDFSAAARRLAQAQGARAVARAPARAGAAATALVGARVAGAARFEQPGTRASAGEPGAPLPLYPDPGQANAAATAVAGSRLDVIG